MRFKVSVYILSALFLVGILGLLLKSQDLKQKDHSAPSKLTGGSATGNAIEFASETEATPQQTINAIKKQTSALNENSPAINPTPSVATNSASSSSIKIFKNCPEVLSSDASQEKRLWCLHQKEGVNKISLSGRKVILEEGKFNLEELNEILNENPIQLSFGAGKAISFKGPIKLQPISKTTRPEELTLNNIKAEISRESLNNCEVISVNSKEDALRNNVLYKEQGHSSFIEESSEEKSKAIILYCP
jgi:hypothetical protein